jgi:hypothetical protein
MVVMAQTDVSAHWSLRCRPKNMVGTQQLVRRQAHPANRSDNRVRLWNSQEQELEKSAENLANGVRAGTYQLRLSASHEETGCRLQACVEAGEWGREL